MVLVCDEHIPLLAPLARKTDRTRVLVEVTGQKTDPASWDHEHRAGELGSWRVR